MKLIIVRHGETEENKQGILMGHLPGILSELGKEQAKKLAERLKEEKIDIIFSSDLTRAKHTADEIAKFHPKIPFELREELRERHLGNFQGKPHDEKWDKAKFDEKIMAEEKAELLEELYNRAGIFLENLKDSYFGKSILLVAHNGINLALINYLLGKKYSDVKDSKGGLGNTSITIFEFDENGKPELKLFNCTKHLEE